MLTRGNYTVWALKMKACMDAHGIWVAVSPKDPKAVVEEKKDKMALAVIYQGIPEDILLSIAEKETAKEAWEAVKVLCQGAERVKTARIQTLRSEFEAMIMKEGESLDDFCLKLNGLVINIRTLGDEMAEAYVVKKVLRAMPHKFLQITSAIEQFGDLEKMSIEEVIGSLKAHEERLRGQPDASGGTNQLLLTEEEWRRRIRRRVNCCLQGRTGLNDCKKPKRDKEQREEANMVQVPDDEPALLLTECDEGEKNVMLINEEKVSPKINKGAGEVVSNLWYLDNGASNHMTGQKSKFKELNEEIKGQVKFGDGSLVQIKGKGSIAIQCKTGDERILHDVYYIPALCSNIISLGQMAEEGYKISMNGDFLW
ncbi:uncharacterized protein LOC141705039, partial [Apium graveolens]|uniref:uncharacterized protein LOC141705039 n=1 Tax=Apium graveolens TaxID=4045 RepID=UPI003D7916C7